MTTSRDNGWIPAALLVGILYLVAGLLFAELAKAATSIQSRNAWRLAAWVVSAILFAAHIVYEQMRHDRSPRVSALHAAAAVALAGFGLAVAANVHAYQVGSAHQRALSISLVAWPLLVAIPAFVVAFAAAAVLARTRRPRGTELVE